MPGGRPTTYDPALGERIVSLMTEGLSLAAAAAECDVHRQRVYDWKNTHPEFDELVRLAMGKRQAFLERRLIAAEAGPVVTSTIFALKNAGREDWQEKVALVGGDENDQPIRTIARRIVDAS
jgi:hypothetical protein